MQSTVFLSSHKLFVYRQFLFFVALCHILWLQVHHIQWKQAASACSLAFFIYNVMKLADEIKTFLLTFSSAALLS